MHRLRSGNIFEFFRFSFDNDKEKEFFHVELIFGMSKALPLHLRAVLAVLGHIRRSSVYLINPELFSFNVSSV